MSSTAPDRARAFLPPLAADCAFRIGSFMGFSWNWVRMAGSRPRGSPIAHEPAVAGDLEKLAEVAVHLPHPGKLLGPSEVFPRLVCEGNEVGMKLAASFRADGP